MNKSALFPVLFISFILWIVINQYFFCPHFSFKSPQPFSGKLLYDPYRSIRCNNWVKCNFHAHTKVWQGFTRGKGTAADIYRVYDSMQYAVHCVSNYENIDTSFSNTPGFIPAYEHGYGINKTHQLVLGSKKVCWIDYLFPQTLSNKQNILNLLSSDPNNVVTINHPASYNGYYASDLKYLTNYNCIEVLNRFAISLAHWDSALSSGKPAFVVGNDDVHNIFSKNGFGKMCTWVNVSRVKEATVLNALKTGKCYGMIVGKQTTALPVLNRFEVLKNDTISIEMSKAAQQISFTGQNGKVLASYTNTSSAQYIMKPGDHYARIVIAYADGTDIFLNPVFRYDGTKITRTPAFINTKKTMIFRFMGMLILAAWLKIAFSLVVSKHIRQTLGKRFPYTPEKLFPRLQ
jgi:hypothetical protein